MELLVELFFMIVVSTPLIELLGFTAKVELMVNVVSYHRVFTLTEPCYEEILRVSW